jgi:TetR/AcrR family transcriptional regulator, mexJK operon transcriptional repressor
VTEKQALRTQMKRQQMRVAAQRLFLQRGFTDASMDMIAAEAGVSKQTLYSYYTNKEDLFADVLEQLTLNNPHNQLLAVDRMPTLNNHNALRAALMMLAQEIAIIMMQPEYLALLRVIIAETPRFPQLATRFRTTVPEQSLAYIVGILKQAQEEGLIAKIDRDAAALMFIGNLLTYALLNGLLSSGEPPQSPTSAQLAPSIDLFMRAIRS